MQQHEIITINSRDRVSGSDSKFVYNIRPRSLEFDRIVILEAHIPKTYYLVQSKYNTFTLTEADESVVIVIPPGNYSRRSFQATLKTLLNEHSPKEYKYNVTYPETMRDADTGKYTFTVENNDHQPSFTFTDSLFEQFGFSMNSTVNFVFNTLVSENVLKFQLEDTLFLYSDLVGGENKTNILQEFYVADGQNYSSVTWHCPEAEKYSRKIATLGAETYSFWLLNEDGQEMELNGGNIVITIQLFKSNTIIDKLKNPDYISALKHAWKFITSN